METLPFNIVRNMINRWWLILFAGLLLIGMGVWVIASPFESYLSLSWAFAFCMMVTGAFEVTFSLINYKSVDGWGWAFAGGLVDLFIGGYLWRYPLITMIILPLIVGVWILFRGIMAVANALDMRSYGFRDWKWLLFTAVSIIVFAMLVLAYPAFGIENLILWTGMAFLLAGVFRIWLSLKIKRIKDELSGHHRREKSGAIV
ncbi:Uncharacterized membrane protein HdeD, DUF308 family [Mucilaginibacter sp. OK268]|uniref:HdeD family acid-resistance protein n=1 Tax=Mucilaginibacter sp. OK268 TaxID=1881048 RepID=UPI000883277C|nr:DUF308 domain-containing protein [Mucilaginibacter sp. OK268]SDP96920.1 Uncharacterized membrane protein HdeD, DUF308 family [Mucilaginibacter sp. OK268]